MTGSAHSTAWNCSDCGQPASIGMGLFAPGPIATHLPMDGAELEVARACTDRGGPFFYGVPAGPLEELASRHQ